MIPRSMFCVTLPKGARLAPKSRADEILLAKALAVLRDIEGKDAEKANATMM